MADVIIDGQTHNGVDILNLEDTDGNEVKFYNDKNLQLDYSTQVTGKPKINGVELDGDKTLEALGIPTGGNVAEWSNEQTFVLEEDVESFQIDVGECSEMIVVLVPYQAESATQKGSASLKFLNENEKVFEIAFGALLETGTKAIYKFQHCHIYPHAEGYKAERVYQTGYLPNSVYFSNMSYPYSNYAETYGINTKKITRLKFASWTSGAYFGKGTTVYYIKR